MQKKDKFIIYYEILILNSIKEKSQDSWPTIIINYRSIFILNEPKYK